MRLEIEMIPLCNWGRNVRSVLTKGEWFVIRQRVYREANFRCQICDRDNVNLHCHEKWSYDDARHIQKLVGFEALCMRCHEVKHFGRAVNEGNERRARRHYMAINNFDRFTAKRAIDRAYAIWDDRNDHQWTLDMDYLKRGDKKWN